MSRLDSFIRRITAQRDCLNYAAELITNSAGVIIELGLGNGRTFDHLRSLFDEREIYVFDREVAAHPSCIPDPDHLILGDIHKTLPGICERLDSRIVLAHCDIGTGDEKANSELAAWLGRELNLVLSRGAIVISDQPLVVRGWLRTPLPNSVAEDRYFMYNVGE